MSKVGKNIKHLRTKKKLNQKQLGDLLGVSQTSVAHYEAGTREPNIETLKQLSKIFDLSIDALIGNAKGKSFSTRLYDDFETLYNDLLNSLLDKEDSIFIDILKHSVIGVYDTEVIIEDIITRVLGDIGAMWYQGRITEADEHYATNLLRKVIGYISVDKFIPIKSKTAITMSIGAEKHTFGIEIISSYLEIQGIKTIYLGNSVQFKSFEEVLNQYHPEFIFLSITVSDNMNHLIALIEYIREKFPEEFVIGVGGQGINDKQKLVAYHNVFIIQDLTHLKSLIE